MEETPTILSSSQARLWFLDKLDPGSALYNSPVRIWLKGELDAIALEKAFARIQERHEILRTVYRTTDDGEPMQVVQPAGQFRIESASVENLPVPDRRRRALEMSAGFGARPFDLAAGPVMFCQLVTLDAALHLLTVSIHHIAGDGWSVGILCRELAAFYGEHACGERANLPDLPIQYADYAVWQRERLQARDLQRGLAYWKEKLVGVPAGVDLPSDRPRPAVQTHRGGTCRHFLSGTLRNSLFALGRSEQASSFMVLVAGLKALLHGYTGMEDIAVGSPVANRNREEIEGLIGCFINTLVLRTRFNAGNSFHELLRLTRQTVLEALEHQDVPLEEIINELHPERSLSISPLFNILFLFHHFRCQTSQAGRLILQPELAFTETSKFDLSLFVFDEPDRLELLAEYNSDLFDEPTVLGLLQDLERLLAAVVAEPDLPLSRLPISAAGIQARNLGYWRRQLGSKLPLVPIPGVRVGMPQLSGRLRRHPFGMPDEVNRSLLECSTRGDDGVYDRLLSAYFSLLHRYTGAEDLLVGVAGHLGDLGELRQRNGTQSVALPLRIRLDGDITFKALSEEVSRLRRNAWEHRYLSPERLAEILKSARPPGMYALYQFMFSFRLIPEAHTESLAWSVPSLAAAALPPRLTLEVTRRENGLDFSLCYRPDLFSAAEIEPIARYYCTLLAAALLDVDVRLSTLPLLTESEREQALRRGVGREVCFAADKCLHELVAEQAARTPNSVALCFEGERMTYAELDRRSSQLAHFLRARQVGPETLVAICLERSFAIVVALLGTLKAGAAYVPLDPSYPAERLAFMLRDSGASIVLTESAAASVLSATSTTRVFLDTEWEDVAGCPSGPVASGCRPENLAYVLYTSGSTGQPKGAMNEHRGIVNRLLWMQEQYGVMPSDAILQKTPFGFDVSVFEFFQPLIAGARLVIARPGGHHDPAYLASIVESEQVTMLHFVPSMLRVFLDTEAPAKCWSLREVFCGGEPLNPELAAHFHSRLKANLSNWYGPSETAVDVTFYPVPRQLTPSVIPIGRPVANTQCYILDALMRPVPAGAVGELHVGGVQVGRGYLNRPKLTEERYVADPFSPTPGGRLFRTGDLCRFLPDGMIEFMGRLDHQVKIRGFRIELGEVESALLSFKGVKQAVVVVREDSPEDRRLVGYVVGDGAPSLPTPDRWREYLKPRLPEYMIPSTVLSIEKLPLLPNGKIDRTALPKPSTKTLPRSQAYVAPRTQKECALAEIWRDILRVSEVGAHDNFFELGGDSILAIQVVTRARKAGLNLTPKLVFQCQTVFELAEAATSCSGGTSQEGVTDGVAPLSPIQSRFFEKSFAAMHHWNQAIELELLQPLMVDRLREALRILMRHHDALRMRFARTDRGWMQHYSEASSEVPFETHDLSGLPMEEQGVAKAEIVERLQASLNLHAGPMLRVARFLIGKEGQGALLLAIHHLVVDAVSWGILLEDLQLACSQLAVGGDCTLPPKTTAYSVWAHRLGAYSQTAAALAEADYWISQVSHREISALAPDTDASGPNTQESAETVAGFLSEAETVNLLQKVAPVYKTQANDALLAALVWALEKRGVEGPLVVFLEGHGREALWEDIDLSRTVGWFTALFPVALQVGGHAHAGEALCRVKEELRRVPHNGLGFGILRYLSHDESLKTRLAQRSVPQIVFNYLGRFGQSVSTGSYWRLRAIHSATARDGAAPRGAAIEMNAGVLDDRFQIEWTFSRNLHRKETIESLARDYLNALREIIAHCLSPEAGGRTPSDFALAGLSQDELNQIYSEFENSR